MRNWPESIPIDLAHALRAFHDARDPDAPEIWWQVTRDWMERHQIEIRLEWLPGLARLMTEADDQPGASGYHRRWRVLRRWLVDHDIPVPASLRPLQ